MLHIAGLLPHAHLCPTLICNHASSARASLLSTYKPDTLAFRPLYRDIKHRKCQALPRARSRRQVVASTQASLQSTFQSLATGDPTTTVLAALGAYVWVNFFDWMATKGALEQVDSYV